MAEKVHEVYLRYYLSETQTDGVEKQVQFILPSFIKAYGYMCHKEPCFGRFHDGCYVWWNQVVHGTFQNAGLPVLEKRAARNVQDGLYEYYKQAEAWKVYPDALRWLQVQQGTSIGIVSNFDDRLPKLMQKLELDQYVEFVATSYDMGVEKPNRSAFTDSVNRFKGTFEPHQVVHIGDHKLRDYEGAKAAGLQAIRIDRTSTCKQNADNIHSFNEILKTYRRSRMS